MRAMSYAEVPAFLATIRESPAIGAMALAFLILTAARTGEVIGARWLEIDLDAKVWTLPAARMKAGREHRVPLSTSALAVLEKLAEAKTGDFVFPGRRLDRQLSGMALEMVLRRMNVRHVTVHGSARHSVIGLAIALASHASLPKLRLPMWPAMPPKGLTGAATRSKSGASSWLDTSKPAQAQPSYPSRERDDQGTCAGAGSREAIDWRD
jgi:Phage integrase family